ncbi:MAG: glycosyl transferase family 2 [Candidatus Aenigmatarchaeota archaeon]|nr:MAG: glycosyl transferase family 2 [Candidatus Aenigmarchaeota archaeon]
MISVIIPAYNSEPTIAECIKSLLDQSYHKPYEIIVVDDGSSDGTAKIARKFRNVKVVRQKNGGPAKARNTGAKKANGNILLFTDADCVAEKNWIEEMVSPLDRKKGIIGVQGRYKTRQRGMVPRFVQMEIEQRYDRMEKAKYIDFVGSYSAAYYAKEFLDFGGFDESFPAASGEDPDLSFRLAKKGYKMVYNPNAVIYHKHPDSLGKYLKTRYYRGYWGRLLYKKHPDKRKESSYKPGFFYYVFFTCISTLFIPLFYLISITEIATYVLILFLVFLIVYDSLYYITKDPRMIVSIPIIYLRNIVIGIGIVSGFIKVKA